jgi:hypothetical protein
LAIPSVTYYMEETRPTNKRQSRGMSTKPDGLLQRWKKSVTGPRSELD